MGISPRRYTEIDLLWDILGAISGKDDSGRAEKWKFGGPSLPQLCNHILIPHSLSHVTFCDVGDSLLTRPSREAIEERMHRIETECSDYAGIARTTWSKTGLASRL
jgi:hypothetical protein